MGQILDGNAFLLVPTCDVIVMFFPGKNCFSRKPENRIASIQ